MHITGRRPPTASAGSAARLAPASARAAALPGERFQARKAWPARHRCRAIGAPMMPVPRKPIVRAAISAAPPR